MKKNVLNLSLLVVVLGFTFSCKKLTESGKEARSESIVNGEFINGFSKEKFHDSNKKSSYLYWDGVDPSFKCRATGSYVCLDDVVVCGRNVECSFQEKSFPMVRAYNENFWKDVCRDDLVEGVSKGTYSLDIVDGDNGMKHYVFRKASNENEGYVYHFIFL